MLLSRHILLVVIVLLVAITAQAQNPNVIAPSPTILDTNGNAIFYQSGAGNVILGRAVTISTATNGNNSTIVVNPSNGGYSTIDCDKTGSGTALPCEIQVGGVVQATFGTTTTNGGQLGVDNANAIVQAAGLFIAGSSGSDVVDYGPGQGRVVGIGGITAANSLTNSSMLRIQSSGGGNGQQAIVSDASGTGRGEPIVIGLCTGGTCNALMEVGTRDTNTGGVLIGQHAFGSLGTPPASGNLAVENGIIGNSLNYIASETGMNNAIAGSLSYVTLSAGLQVTVKLAHTLQGAGANTFNLNTGGALSIKSHLNTGNNIATGYATGGLITLMYDGTQWEDMSQ